MPGKTQGEVRQAYRKRECPLWGCKFFASAIQQAEGRQPKLLGCFGLPPHLLQCCLSPASSVSIPFPQPVSHSVHLPAEPLAIISPIERAVFQEGRTRGAKRTKGTSQGIASKPSLHIFFSAPEPAVFPCLIILWKSL